MDPSVLEPHLEQIDDVGDYSILLPAHLAGFFAGMDRIDAIARRHRLSVFGDLDQAHGTLFKGKMCGSMSTASDSSFYIVTNIQARELGGLVCDEPRISSMAFVFHWLPLIHNKRRLGIRCE